jgi:hypothetical protein
MIEHSTKTQLPEEVLSQVLRHVSCGDRLLSCSLVCKAWRAAAAAATSYISMWFYCINKASRCASLMHWLHEHGAAVTDLMLDNGSGKHYSSIDLQLPYSNLRQLQRLYV